VFTQPCLSAEETPAADAATVAEGEVAEAQPVIPDNFEDLIAALPEADFATKAAAIERLTALNDARTLPVLRALLETALYFRPDVSRVVITAEAGELMDTRDAVSNESLGAIDKGELQKITVNNALRGQLRGALAQLSLHDPDPAVRLAAVDDLIKNIDRQGAERLRAALTAETDGDVRARIATGLALIDIQSEDQAMRLAAIATLGDSLNPEAVDRLTPLLAKDEQGQFLEADPQIRKAAGAAIRSIQERLKFYRLLETTFFGLSLGSVLLLVAIGLAITFGVMGVINMAHGELMMLGAYTTYLVQLAMPNHIDISILVAIPAAFLVAGLAGIAIERGVIRFLYGRPLETLLATFGISLILQQLVRSTISAQNVTVANPGWLSGSLQINEALSITYNRIYILVFALLVFAALLLILKKTTLGLQVRAVSQNRAMAKAMGIRTEWVDAMTFGLGAGIAGVAGVALSQLTNVGPNMGQSYIIDSFMVVVFGGVGNLWGTLVGALSLGVANKFMEPWAGAVLAKILVLVFIILFIQKRPRGLFPQKGRAAEH
jgi:urea transport system permease protein